jgi:putative FmdB family regulatory protein
MPTYDYHCDECGNRFDAWQKMTDEPLTVCPKCAGHVHRVIHPTGILFKGSGFYSTDQRGSTASAQPTPAEPATAGATSAAGEKPAVKAAESSSTSAGESGGQTSAAASASAPSSSSTSPQSKAAR